MALGGSMFDLVELDITVAKFTEADWYGTAPGYLIFIFVDKWQSIRFA